MAASRGAPAVELNSAPFAITVSEHYDTGEFQHYCKDTKWPNQNNNESESKL